MTETIKTIAQWTDYEKSLVQGSVIDIGCGSDPISPSARCFDIDDGDANYITKFIHVTYDCVYSSHCLEHMVDAKLALKEWWKLVKPGGYLILIVPDEDLYEQGEFPSRFNSDHKWTFTISKRSSWSPVSINLLDLAKSLPSIEVISIELQDLNYDRSLLKHGNYGFVMKILSLMYRGYRKVRGRSSNPGSSLVESIKRSMLKVDQTDPRSFPHTLAQIQLIARKTF